MNAWTYTGATHERENRFCRWHANQGRDMGYSGASNLLPRQNLNKRTWLVIVDYGSAFKYIVNALCKLLFFTCMPILSNNTQKWYPRSYFDTSTNLSVSPQIIHIVLQNGHREWFLQYKSLNHTKLMLQTPSGHLLHMGWYSPLPINVYLYHPLIW